jgi:hypothetical protein
MATRPLIRNRYPRPIELDNNLGTLGPSFLRVCSRRKSVMSPR